MVRVAQFFERLFWVFLLAFFGAIGTPGVTEVLNDLVSSAPVIELSAVTAAWVAGTVAVLREVVAFGQARIAVLPNPGNVPTPIVAKFDKAA